MELQGSKVLLTGATGGIGQAIARALHAAGAELVVTGRRAEVLNELRDALGDRVTPLPADLSDRDALAELARAADGVDILVANAALPASGPIEDFSPEEIDRALEVNLRAPIQLTRALVPGMVERGRGHVVLISSLSGKVSSPGSGLYSAAKFGLRGFGGSLRQDLEGSGVGVSLIYPGFISDAGMFADANVKLPPGVGTSTAGEVAEAIKRAIEQDEPEVDVAPLGMRAGTFVATLAPVTAAKVQRKLGGDEISDQLWQGQRDKR
jgi:short-subunit dehydrogenase